MAASLESTRSGSMSSSLDLSISRGELDRVAVVGTSCSGKSTLARSLAAALGAPHIELDQLYWGPNWTPVAAEQFRSSLVAATSQSRWVCDGNYSSVRDIIWPRVTAIVWLNYSFPRVFGRGLRRTVGRCLSRTPLFAGNRESFRTSFLSRDSILLWILKTHWKYQREYPRRFAEARGDSQRFVELRSPADAESLLCAIRHG